MTRGGVRIGLLALALAFLAGCETPPPETPAPASPARPTETDPEQPQPLQRSKASFELERHYARVQADLLGQGLLRTDRGGADTPFAEHNLVSNFIRIALYDEYVTRAGTLVAEQTASQLRRWKDPVRMKVTFGPTVPAAKQATDRAALSEYVQRLSRTADHPISVTQGSGANFHVLILHEDERRNFAPQLRQMIPGIGPTAIRTIESMPRDTFCLVFAFSRASDPAYTRAVAVIRAEHPDLLRLSCIHEEVAQGLGLANDSPRARPSIFNDDEEFALLTGHDELLLRMLYDRRLSVGMTAQTARPIVEEVATELLGGES